MRLLSLASLMIGSAAALGPGSAQPIPAITLLPEPPRRGKAAVKIRTGQDYPHSSERQRARYARQLAAGQIKNAA